MDTIHFCTFEEFEAAETTPQALIDARKYIGAGLFFGNVQHIFNDVLDDMESENYQGTTVECMKTACNRTVARLNALEKSDEIIRKYINDIKRATKEAINDQQ